MKLHLLREREILSVIRKEFSDSCEDLTPKFLPIN